MTLAQLVLVVILVAFAVWCMSWLRKLREADRRLEVFRQIVSHSGPHSNKIEHQVVKLAAVINTGRVPPVAS